MTSRNGAPVRELYTDRLVISAARDAVALPDGSVSIQAVTGSFGNGALTVFGDALDNNIVVSRDAAGKLLVNGGAVATRAARRPWPTPA